jgi:hypothetical protein
VTRCVQKGACPGNRDRPSPIERRSFDLVEHELARLGFGEPQLREHGLRDEMMAECEAGSARQSRNDAGRAESAHERPYLT